MDELRFELGDVLQFNNLQGIVVQTYRSSKEDELSKYRLNVNGEITDLINEDELIFVSRPESDLLITDEPEY